MWNQTYIKVWIWFTCEDPREKNITKWKSSKKGEISCCFGTFVREKKVRVTDKHLCSECSKTFILPLTWRGTWWANCTRKSPKRKRAEQLSCEEWECFYQNQITSKKSTGNGKILTLLAWLSQLWLKKLWHKFLKYQIGTYWKHSQYWEKSCQKKLFNSVRILCVIGSEHSQSLLLLEFCDILDRCASEQMKIIWSAPLS